MKPVIRQVWRWNFHRAFLFLDNALYKLPIVAVDTEFPGFFRNRSRNATEAETYSDVKFAVDQSRVIQFGITVTDYTGGFYIAWEFNLQFDVTSDRCDDSAIKFLENNGLDFEKLKEEGIDILLFAEHFKVLVSKHKNLQWVTFHGLYDMAHSLKMVKSFQPLPDSILEFTQLLGEVFGCIVDLKYVAQFCDGLNRGELGLQRLANLLKVKRRGGAHNAGSDSLLTAHVFRMMKMMYPQASTAEHKGFLFGITPRILGFFPMYATPPPLPGFRFPPLPYCCDHAIPMLHHGVPHIPHLMYSM